MKKKIPLILLETMQPMVAASEGLIKVVPNDEAFYHVIDCDSNSNFFFRIKTSEMRSSPPEMHYNIVFQPRSVENMATHTTWETIRNVKVRFTDWIDMIKRYSQVHTIYDDPITQAYEDEFVAKFEIFDPDAAYAPFKLEQQLFLDEYLTKVEVQIEAYKGQRSEDEKAELQRIQEDARSLKTDLSNLSKQKVVRRLSKIWAKSRKFGLDLLREILLDVAVDFTKKLMSGL